MESQPPAKLNWDAWIGQATMVPYVKERTHLTFRFWYDYSGGTITDWGAHHIDIAQWGMDKQYTGPVEITSEATFPQSDGRSYNVATMPRSPAICSASPFMPTPSTIRR